MLPQGPPNQWPISMHLTVWPAGIGFIGHYVFQSEPMMAVAGIACVAHIFLLPFMLLVEDWLKDRAHAQRQERQGQIEVAALSLSTQARPTSQVDKLRAAQDATKKTGLMPAGSFGSNEEATPELEEAVRAARAWLQQRGSGSIHWFFSSLKPPVFFHLAFRYGNQLFFVTVHDSKHVPQKPSAGIWLLARLTGGICSRMPMRRTGSSFTPEIGGWGLAQDGVGTVDEVTLGASIDVEREAACPPHDMSTWEIQEHAVQVVCDLVEKQGGRIDYRTSFPAALPSIMFTNHVGRGWIIVLATKHPAENASLPSTTKDLMEKFADWKAGGYVAFVALSGSPQADKLVRGGTVRTNASELIPVAEVLARARQR